MSTTDTTQPAPPRDNLYRGLVPAGAMIRAAGSGSGDGDEGPVMEGHFAVFNQWTEINSCYEGHFLERFAPGSFKKTIKESRDSIRCLFEHGYDYRVCDKPLGPFDELREDEIGVYYAVPLLDAPYVREDVLPGLAAGLFGASFRFRSIREEFNQEPGESEHNPNGLPERTIKECKLFEGGPVVFPAYETATAGLRSLTDKFVLSRFARDPDELRSILKNVPAGPMSTRSRGGEDQAGATEAPDADAATGADREVTPDSENRSDAPPEQDAAPAGGTSDAGRRDSRSNAVPLYGTNEAKKEKSWLL